MSKLKLIRFVSLLVIAMLVLAACGQQATPTPGTGAVTEATATTETVAAEPTATEAVAEEATPTEPAAAEEPTPTTEAAGGAEATATKPVPEAAKEGTLTLWVHESILPAIEAAGKDFTAKYNVPVNVQLLGFGDIRDQLKLAGPAGEGPDIIVGAHDWLGELVQNGVVEPLDLGEKAASFDEVSIKAFTYGGKLYGVPYGTEAIALIYNTDLVPTAPTTWDDMKRIAKELQDAGKVDQGFALQGGDPYHAYPFWTTNGSSVFGTTPEGDPDPKQVNLDNEGGQAAIKEMDQMVKDGLLRKDVTGDIVKSLFIDGKAAMIWTGPWNINDLNKSAVAGKYDIAKIPAGPQPARPFIGAQGFMVSAFAKNKDVAKAFLTEYIATDEVQEALYNAAPRIPSWKALAEKLAGSQKLEDQQIAKFAQSAADGVPMPAIPEMSSVWESWTKAINLVFNQQEDPVKAIQDAATAIREKIGTSQ